MPLPSFRLSVATALAASMIALLPAGAADVRRACYAITAKTSFYVTGEMLRRAALTKTNAVVNSDNAIGTTKAPAGPKQCTVGAQGGGPPGNIPAMSSTNYFGNLASRVAFRRFSQMPCGANLPQPHRYFSMGDSLFYRQCAGGDGNGYVYFWGVANDNKSACFRDDYPSMFAIANANAKKPVTLAQMAQTYSGGLPASDDAANALKAAMAAVLIAESYRDILVVIENYMLMDVAKVTPAMIIAGRCPSGLGAMANQCLNPDAPKDGLHPIAWGRAQAVMMANNAWGYNAAATSDFGESFEASLIATWLVTMKPKQVATAKAGTCDPAKPYGNYLPDQRAAVESMFSELLPAK